MAAGRPRSFCTEKALDAAMQVFWRKGYEGASMVDLTHAIGINSPSLYAAFGSKEGLFKQVLDRYDARRTAFMQMVVEAPTAHDAARLFLHGVAEFCVDTGGKTPPGCFFMQCGQSGGERQITDEVARHRAEKEQALAQRFTRARDEGELAADTDPCTLARYLSAMANGMAVQASSGATVAELHEIADLALASWPGKTAATPRAKELAD